VSKKNSTKTTKTRYDRYRRARAALRQVMQQARHKTVDLDNTSVEIGVFDTDDHRLIGTVIITLRDLSLLANHSCEIDAMTRAAARVGSRVVATDWTPTPGGTLRQAVDELSAAIEDKTLDKLRAVEDLICRKVVERLGVQPVGWAGILATRDDLMAVLTKDRIQRMDKAAEQAERTATQNTLGAVLQGLGLPAAWPGPDLTVASVVKRIAPMVPPQEEPITVTGGHNPFIGPVSFGGRQGGKNTIAAGARAGIAELLARVGIATHPDDPTLSAAKGAQLVNEKIEKQVANQAEAIRRSERAVILDELQVAPSKSDESANTREATVAAIRDIVQIPTELIAQRTMMEAATRLRIYPDLRASAASIQQIIVDFHQAREAAARLDGAVTVARDILPTMPKTVDEIATAVRRKRHQAALDVAHNIAVELYGDDGQHVKDGGDLIAMVRRRSPSGEPLNRAADLVEVAERRRLLTTVNYGSPVDNDQAHSLSWTVGMLRRIIRHQTLQQLHNLLLGPDFTSGAPEIYELPGDISVNTYAAQLQDYFDGEKDTAVSIDHAKMAAVHERYEQIRARYTVEHDRQHHTLGDFTDSAIALLMSGRDRLHVSMGHKHNSRAEVWAVLGRRELWKLGRISHNEAHVTDSTNDRERLVEAAALLMCAAEAFTP
jgi:hypothetical protein